MARPETLAARWGRTAALAGAVAVVLGSVLAALIWSRREPQLRGHPVSYWVLGWRHAHAESPESVAAAYAAMDGSHVRWLRRQLHWRPSQVRDRLSRLSNRLGLPVSLETADDYREQAAAALGRLGERARPAVPDLEAASRTTIEPRAHQARVSARAALISLGAEPVEPVLHAARSPDGVGWYVAADVLCRLEGHRREAQAIFAEVMHGTNPPALRSRAIQLYRLSAPPLAEAVSNLSRALGDPGTRAESLAQLGMLGPLATSADGSVRAVLNDPDIQVRRMATNTLRRLTDRP